MSTDHTPTRGGDAGRAWRYARAMAHADDEDLMEWEREYGRRARAAMAVADAEIAAALENYASPAGVAAPGDMAGLREAAQAALDAWLEDEFGSDVLPDAMSDLKAALSPTPTDQRDALDGRTQGGAT